MRHDPHGYLSVRVAMGTGFRRPRVPQKKYPAERELPPRRERYGSSSPAKTRVLPPRKTSPEGADVDLYHCLLRPPPGSCAL